MALQLKLSLSGLSAGASAPHTLPFGFNPGDARDMSLIGRGVLILPPFVGPFCRPVGAQYTTQPWRVDNLKIKPCTPLIVVYVSINGGDSVA